MCGFSSVHLKIYELKLSIIVIFTGFAASDVLLSDEEDSAVMGIATRDVGIGKDGKKASYKHQYIQCFFNKQIIILIRT